MLLILNTTGNNNFKKNHSRIIIILFLIFYTSLSFSFENFKNYYQELDKQKAPGERISTLLDIIKTSPHQERAYTDLLHSCQTNADRDSVLIFIKNLSPSPYSSFVQARIYEKINDNDTALRFYLNSVRTEQVIPYIVYYFMQFINKTGTDVTNIIETFSLENKNLARAFLYLFQQNYIKASEYIAKANNNKAFVMEQYAFSEWKLGHYNKADSLLQAGLFDAIKTKDIAAQVLLQTKQGYFLSLRGNMDKALVLHQQALKTAQSISAPHLLSRIDNNIGVVYYMQSRYSQALPYFQQAIKNSGLFDDDWKCRYYINLGMTCKMMAQYSQALTAYNMAEDLARQNNDKQQIASANMNKGDLYLLLKLNNLAKTSYETAQNNFQANDKNYYKIQAKLVEFTIQQGQYTKAEKEIKNYIASLGPTQNVENAYWNYRIAGLYEKQKEYSLAEKQLNKSIELARKANSSDYQNIYSFQLVKLLLKQNNAEQALTLLNNIPREHDLNDHNKRWFHYYYGQALSQTGQTDKAIFHYKQAAVLAEKTLEQLSLEELEIGFLAPNSQIYKNLSVCYFQKYQQQQKAVFIDSLYYFEEMSRLRVFKDNINDVLKNHQVNKTILKDYETAKENLQHTIFNLRSNSGQELSEKQWDLKIGEFETAKRSFLAQKLKLYNTKKKKNISKQKTYSVKDLQHYVTKNNCGVLLYHIHDNASFVLCITPDTTKIVQLDINMESLKARTDSLILPFFKIKENNLSDIPYRASLAYQLYLQLFRPLERAVSLPNKLFIVPDNLLLNIPFEILLTQEPAKKEYTVLDTPDYKTLFLLNKYTTSYHFSTTNILSGSKPGKKDKIVAFANPFVTQNESMDKQLQFRWRTGFRFEPLPFAELEAQQIKKINNSTNLFTREAANEQNLQLYAQKCDILHFATHAFADTLYDIFSGLVLATPKDSLKDGLLLGYEIPELNLNCQLVTLSACETGRGQVVSGEGVLGLPRLFIKAGARTVMMTLWKVDDYLTSKLVPKFYSYFIQKNVSKAKALRLAKLDILSLPPSQQSFHYQHPVYWASFMLYGDPGFAAEPPACRLTLILFGLSGLIFVVIITWVIKIKNRKF